MKSARKAKDKLHKACERASEIREQTLHRHEQNRMCMVSMRYTLCKGNFENILSLVCNIERIIEQNWHSSGFFLLLFVLMCNLDLAGRSYADWQSLESACRKNI